jgi:hypothetical protein
MIQSLSSFTKALEKRKRRRFALANGSRRKTTEVTERPPAACFGIVKASMARSCLRRDPTPRAWTFGGS